MKTGLGPGKQVIIERPKPRGDGGIQYVPEKVHPNTMAFLKDLKHNNDREWLKSKSFTVQFAEPFHHPMLGRNEAIKHLLMRC